MDSAKQLLVEDPIIAHCNVGAEFLAGNPTSSYWNINI